MNRTFVALLAAIALASCTAAMPDVRTPRPSPDQTEAPTATRAPATPEPTVEQPETACEAAFRTAAAVGDFQDTVEDLDPAVKACATVEDWIAASELHPSALDDVDPVTFLSNRCLFGEALADTPLCKALDQ